MVTGRRQIWLLAGAKYGYWQPPDMVAGMGIFSERDFLLIGKFSESLGIFLNCQSLSFESLLRMKKYQVRNEYFRRLKILLIPSNSVSFGNRFLLWWSLIAFSLRSESFVFYNIENHYSIFKMCIIL